MGTATAERQQRKVISRYREERYIAHEADRVLREELTEASEKLVIPMENEIPFIYGEDKKLYSEHGEQIEGTLTKGIHSIEALLPSHPDYAFEADRRRIELTNLVEHVQKLKHHEMLVEYSLIPDAVREGRTTIDGYDRKRLKMLVRVSQRNFNKINVISFSLDQSNLVAVQAAAEAIGHTLPLDQGSEAVLATPAHLTECHEITAKDMVSVIRKAYDASLSEQFGGDWYAGRRPMSLKNAMNFIIGQKDLVDQHMEVMASINSRNLLEGNMDGLKAVARYNFAAALDDRLHGDEVVSLSDAGDGARSENRSYDGDCPTVGSTSTSSEAASSTTESALQKVGYMQGERVTILSCVECPHCHSIVDAILTKKVIMCATKEDGGCGAIVDLNTGLRIDGKAPNDLSGTPEANDSSTQEKKNASKKRPDRIGKYIIRQQITIGGADQVAVHEETGEQLTANQTKLLIADSYELTS